MLRKSKYMNKANRNLWSVKHIYEKKLKQYKYVKTEATNK